ncbi:MAG: DEAD/DEAH box helicase [Promethearchaeia archaeon]
MNFDDLGISNKYTQILKEQMEITEPTEVQEEAIPPVLKGKHVMAQSKTGTGKTLAFLLPIIEQLKFVNNEVLIIAPTRELAKQTNRVVQELKDHELKSMTIYGGTSINRQIKKLKKGVNIIVGTPGRLIDLYKRGKLKFNNLRFLVLDEADRLLDMGFFPDIKYILSKINHDFQFLLFSATMEYEIRELVKEHTGNSFKFIDISKDDLTVTNTNQYYYMISDFHKKFDVFCQVLNRERPESAIVFINTKRTGNWLFNKMKSSYLRKFYYVGYISGDLSQNKREKILRDFRSDKIDILIATDVAARGWDIEGISHIINYDLPKYPESYVHRIGRTSRMDKKGTAITLCLKNEYEYLCKIEGFINKEIRKRSFGKKKKHQKQRFPYKSF